MCVCERRQSEQATYCMIQLYDHQGKAKLWRQQRDQQLPGVPAEGGMGRGAQRSFRAVKLFCGSCHSGYMSKPMECIPPRVKPKLWMLGDNVSVQVY